LRKRGRKEGKKVSIFFFISVFPPTSHTMWLVAVIMKRYHMRPNVCKPSTNPSPFPYAILPASEVFPLLSGEVRSDVGVGAKMRLGLP